MVTWWAALSIQIPPTSIFSVEATLLLRRIASTLATRILGLKGLDIYSSTPRENPWSSSRSSLLAVSMITGTREYLRMVFNTSHPSILGIITSSSTRAMSFCAKKVSTASSPSPASITAKPLLVRKSLTSFLILASSSTTNILSASMV